MNPVPVGAGKSIRSVAGRVLEFLRMINVDKTCPVLVTGASGYVAGRIVEKLLKEGFQVHAAIRDIQNPEKRKWLDQLEKDLPGSLRYFETDLLKEGSYFEAMQGCSYVFHTASPFKIDVRDPEKDLIAPALLGTQNVLNEVNRTSSVKRVVLTSSCAAIYGDNIDLRNTPNGVFTEDIWNVTSSISHQPYSYSKTLSEREAWKISEGQGRWSLVVMNPSLVVGPGVNPFGTSESFSFVRQLGDGTMKQGVPCWGFGVVDVRDVAEAHFRAAFDEKAQGRYIISGHNTDLVEMARVLLSRYGKSFPIPRRAMPKFLVWLLAPMVNSGMTRKMVSRNVNHLWKASSQKSIRDLGMTYRSLEESMTDFFQQMIDHGQLEPKLS